VHLGFGVLRHSASIHAGVRTVLDSLELTLWTFSSRSYDSCSHEKITIFRGPHMTPEVVMQLFGNALFLVVLIVSLIVGPGLAVGLIVSMFQAATQINEQTLSFLPRLLITLGAIMFLGGWLITQFTDLFNELFLNIPLLIG
jgi:flagellar biosynthetic protein FliQ